MRLFSSKGIMKFNGFVLFHRSKQLHDIQNSFIDIYIRCLKNNKDKCFIAYLLILRIWNNQTVIWNFILYGHLRNKQVVLYTHTNSTSIIRAFRSLLIYLSRSNSEIVKSSVDTYCELNNTIKHTHYFMEIFTSMSDI